MKKSVKLCIFALVLAIVMSLFAVSAFAEGSPEQTAETDTVTQVKLPMDDIPSSIGERLEIALQGTVTGMVMVFAVLGLLAVILTLSKVVFYDIPNRKSEKTKKESAPAPAAVETAPADVAPVTADAPVQDDGELVAVITAAVAAMIESSDYKNEFAGGFRVVSFKRSTQSAWNRK